MRPSNDSESPDRDGVDTKPAPPPGRAFTIAAFWLALLGLALFPVGGIAAMACGWIGCSRGDRSMGLVAMAAGAVSFVASFVIAARVLG